MKLAKPAVAFSLLLLSPAAALAHTGVDQAAHHHLAGGLLHPFTGADHIVALVALGLWSTLLTRRARGLALAGFLGMMLVGALLAPLQVSAPIVDGAILASIFITGLLLAASLRLRAGSALVLAGAFALLHGYAHAADMPANTVDVGYAAGFVVASGILLAIGVALGQFAIALNRRQYLRIGGGIAVAAAMLLAVVTL